ncbi:hypothetical protein scyTo_0000755 [Scyliorhinus torazame]|uniref:Uncharacterized protein n=1 Tax=Scyliorhinus torazame TaxID=75743 RepID=A0A401P3G3_SCYTO|nr:hypothetical protein [Scyliorhinus torazame]
MLKIHLRCIDIPEGTPQYPATRLTRIMVMCCIAQQPGRPGGGSKHRAFFDASKKEEYKKEEEEEDEEVVSAMDNAPAVAQYTSWNAQGDLIVVEFT